MGEIEEIRSLKIIKDKIKNTQNLESKWKTHWNQGVLLKLFNSEIELILRIKIQMRTYLNN